MDGNARIVERGGGGAKVMGEMFRQRFQSGFG